MNRKRSGFSLVLSLAIMAGMVMLVIILAAFLQVETRLALGHSGYMRARLNAIASAKMALGQLQQLAGPDQRVTMRADMYDAGKTPGAQSSTTVPQSGSGNMVYNPSAPAGGKLSHQKRYWTGVWATGGVDSSKVRDWDVMNPHKSRLFLGWLSSPCYISSAAPYDTAEYLTKPLPNYLPNRSYFTPKSQTDGVFRNELTNLTANEGQVLIDDLANNITSTPDTTLVPLLSRGSVKFPAVANTSRGMLEYYGQVDALPVPLPGPNSTVSSGINGRYAFWIGDEGIKAKANLPDAYAAVKADGTGYTTPLEDWDDGLRGSAAQRNAIEVIAGTDLKDSSVFPGGFNWDTWRTADVGTSTSWNASKMARVTDTNTLILWANTVGGTAAGDAMKDASKALFHDVTALSYSTITDIYNGGVKCDLSTAFELPYTTYRGLEMSYGQKNSTVTTSATDRITALFHNATNRSRPLTAGGSGGTAAVDNIIDLNKPNYGSTFSYAQPTTTGLLKFSPRSPEWAPKYIFSTSTDARYSDLKTQNGNEEPERVGFVYEVPLRSAFWNGVVSRINPLAKKTDGSEGIAVDSDNLNARIERGPTWDLYRNYYRNYKMEIEQCHKNSAIRGQDNTNFGDGVTVFARGIEPLNNSTFQNQGAYNYTGTKPTGPAIKDWKKGPIGWNSSASNDTSRGPISFFHNYGSATDPGPQYRMHAADWKGLTDKDNATIPWPTSMKLAPSIIRFAFMYSTVWKNVNGKEILGIAVDPFIVVHNPYDSPIEFPGIAMITNEKEVSHLFQFYLNGKQIGDVFTGQSYQNARQYSFRAIAGENGNSNVFRLEPGEIQVISATSTDTELSGYNAIEIAGQFKKRIDITNTSMFFPMDPFALNIKMAAGGALPTTSTTKYPVKKDSNSFIGLSDALGILKPTLNINSPDIYPSISNSKTPRQLITDVIGGYMADNPLALILAPDKQGLIAGKVPNWDGEDFSILKTAGNLTVKIINYDGDQFNPSAASGTYIFGERKWRGSGHITDGGSQKWNFHLQYSKDYEGNNFSPTRRWVGPIYEPAIWKDSPTQPSPNPYPSNPEYTNLTNGNQAIVQMHGIDEPLLLSFRALTSGWPAYGSALDSYFAPNPDPEYPGTKVEGFTPKYSASLVLTDNGQEKSVSKSNVKNPFFIHDFFVRGSTECEMPKTDVRVLPHDETISDGRMVTPLELRNSPMSPFAFSTRAPLASFYSYDGKSHAPVGWIESQRNVEASDPLIPFNFNADGAGSWGNSALSKTNSRVILFSLPRRPLLSLAQLGSASTSQDSVNPDLSIGSSFAHPGIKDLSKICDWPGTKGGGTWDSVYDLSVPEHGYAVKAKSGSGEAIDKTDGKLKNLAISTRGLSSVRTDVAFASNLALWDSYWFSGLNTQEPSYSDAGGTSVWPNGPNLPTHTEVIKAQTKGLDAVKAVDNKKVVIDLKTMSGVKTALESGYNPLANKRVTYIPDVSKAPDTLTNTIFPNYLSFPHPSYLGRRSLYNGGFNVNSTSKAAWKAVLGAMKNQKMPDGTVATGTALTRFARAFGANDGSSKPWECYHDITNPQLDDLAAAVVKEVSRRGPFMSLSDFVNRRLVNDDNFGLKGALQAAIDATDINGSTEITNSGGTFSNYLQSKKGSTLPIPYFPVVPKDRFPSARAMSKTNEDDSIVAGLGAPGIISQMDILNSVGPNLTARSDTFVIRAYGEAFDNNGNSIGKAWVEVVAQRSTDFVVLTDQRAQSLNISAEPNIRAPAYRDNNKTASKSDYDAKPVVDMYQRNTSTDATKNQLINLNRVLGRRFKTVGMKWLNPQDI